MKINNLELVSRYQRPSFDQDLALELFYMRNGVLADPQKIDSVLIFADTTVSSDEYPYITNGDGSALIESDPDAGACYGKVLSSLIPFCVARFQVSGTSRKVSDGGFNPAVNYNESMTSGISKLNTGHFAVGLSGGGSYTSGTAQSCDLDVPLFEAGIAEERVSAPGTFFDVWMMKDSAPGIWQSVVQKFTVTTAGVITFPEKAVLTITNSLKQSHVHIGEKINLAIETQISGDEANMSPTILNMFQQAMLGSAEIAITYVDEHGILHNDGTKGSTSGFEDVTNLLSDDTMLYLWDSTDAVPGVYKIQAKYDFMDETRKSPVFSFVVRP